MRADLAAADQFPSLTRSRIRNLCLENRLFLNGKPTRPAAKVRAGDILAIEIPPTTAPESLPQEISLDILFEDDAIVVVNKPPGLVVHPAAGNPDGTLVNALLHHCTGLSGIGGVNRPGIVHRLDKETSGCIVAAKTNAAHASLAAQFAGRSVTKTYLAFAQGNAKFTRMEVRTQIGRHPVDRKKMAVLTPPAGRAAHTDVTTLARAEGLTLFRCDLHTGRTHQIRVHLRHLNHPILGDVLYGAKKTPAPGRVMLHAWRLGICHPHDARPLVFTAPPPPDFLELAAAHGIPEFSLEI